MTIKTVDSHQARHHWREMLEMALGQEVDIVITQHDKPVVTILDYEDYLSIREELAHKRAQRLASRQLRQEALTTMLATEQVLSREWGTPEEDEAWQDL